jgi:hypothetical protein
MKITPQESAESIGNISAVLNPRDLFHTGIVVADLDEAMARMSAVAGYQWTVSPEHESPIRTADGRDIVPNIRRAYSLQAPRIELVRAMEGTIWWPDSGSALHHLGYFVDDLVAASEALEGLGIPAAVRGRDAGTVPSRFAYHRTPEGMYLEIIPRNRFPDFEAYIRDQTPAELL